MAVVAAREQHREHRHEREARDRQRVRQPGERRGDGAGAHCPRIVTPVVPARKRTRRIPDVTALCSLPGFVDAHSHGFQRALRGRSAGADFWAWRETMLAEAARQTPATIRSEYELTYRELLAAGYTAVGEFHYLGFDEALAAAEAAAAAGIELVLLHAAYGRGGARTLPPAERRRPISQRSRRLSSAGSASVSPRTPSAPARRTG